MTPYTIWKYSIPEIMEFTLQIPAFSKILHIDVQGVAPQIWVAVDPEKEDVTRRFRLYATGETIIQRLDCYVGTFQCPPYVWHLFEVTE